MKYCINYFERNFQYLNEVDEITVRFRPSDPSLEQFMLEHSQQRINIYIEDEEDFLINNRVKLFVALAQEHPELDFALKLRNFKEQDTQRILQAIVEAEAGLRYFFNTKITDWDTLWGYIKLHPSDIYITEALGFEIRDCAAICHEIGIAVRVFPNVAQSSFSSTAGIVKFFIRPEDIPIYEPYIDVCEIFGSGKKVNTYYKVYAKDKKWTGNLNELIISLNQDIDSRGLLPNFAERRLNCGKKCLRGRPCQICAVQKELSDILTKNNITMRQLQRRKRDNGTRSRSEAASNSEDTGDIS